MKRGCARACQAVVWLGAVLMVLSCAGDPSSPGEPWVLGVERADEDSSGVPPEWCDDSATSCQALVTGEVLSAPALVRTGLGAGAVLEVDDGVLLLLGDQSRAQVRNGQPRTIDLVRGTFGFEQIGDAERGDGEGGSGADERADESEPAGAATAQLAGPSALPVLRVLDHLVELGGRRPAGVAVEVTPEDASLTVRFGRVWLRAVGGEAIELRAGETVLLEPAEQVDRRAAWTGDAAPVAPVQRRDAAALPQDATVQPRGIGRMTARVPGNEQQVDGVRLVAHHARVVIRDGLARTEVVEEFHNETGRVLEGRYVFPLPPDASISRLALWVGDELVEGEMIERRRASRIFDAIVEDSIRPRDPALLEWVAGSEFSLKIFPIMPHSSRRVLLAYNQAVPIEGRRARYVYPMSLGSDRSLSIDRFSMSVTVAEPHRSVQQVAAPAFDALVKPTEQGAEVRYAAERFVPARDFVVRYRVEPTPFLQPAVYVPEPLAAEAEPSSGPAPSLVERSAGEQDAGYVSLRLVAELPEDMPPPALEDRDRVIVIDRSHSQAPETLQAQSELAAGLLAAMAAGESFAVLACEAACESYPGAGMVRARPGAIQAATRWLRSLHPRGASDLAGAIRAGSSRLQGRAGAQLIVLSDGTPTAGELSAARIAERVGPELAEGIDLRLYGLGRTVDEMVLRHLAQSLGGIYEPIAAGEPLRTSLERLTVALRAPVIRAAELELPSSFMAVYPRRLPNLRLGQPLQVVAKLTAQQPGAVTLKGTLDGQPYQLVKAVAWPRSRDAQNPLVPRLWAEARIADLQGSGDPAHREQIVALSRHHHVMSRHTALLVLENDRMYREFGVQRTQRGSSRLRGDAAWREATRGAEEFGMIGLLNSGAGGDPDAPTAPWGRDDSLKEGGVGQRAPGADRLGLDGIGEGGGGRGEGIGLGDIGTIGHGAGTGTGQGFGAEPDANRPGQIPGGMGTVQGRGPASGASSAATPKGRAAKGSSRGFGSGSGRLGRGHRTRPPRVRMGATSVSGRLPPEVIQRIVRQNFGRFRLCYENGLRANPDLQGRVVVRFVIGRDGMVSNVGGSGDLPDGQVITCVTRAFYGLSFPQPEGGIVTVSYPIVFRPGDPATTRDVPTANVWRPGRQRLVPPPVTWTSTPRGRTRSVRFRADVVHASCDERWREQAEPQLERLRQRATEQQGSRRAQAELVRGLLHHGRFSEALESARGFSELDPDHGVAHELVAHAAAAAGQGVQAARALAALVELEPRSAELQRRVARAHEALGDGLRACAHWRAAVALEPLDRRTGKQAERCWRMLGGLHEAQGTGEIGPRPGEADPDLAEPSGSRARLRPAVWFEAKLEGPASDRPMILVVTPSGQVHSAWTPASGQSLPGPGVDGGGRQVGTYRTVLVGGAVDWQGTLVLRAGNRWKRFEVQRNHRPLQTIAASYVRARYWW